MDNAYLDSLYGATAKARKVSIQSLDKDILGSYKEAGKQLVDKFSRTKEGSATRAFYADYIRSLDKATNDLILQYGYDTTYKCAEVQSLMMTDMFAKAGLSGVDFSAHFGKIPHDTLKDFLGGGIYKDGIGLSPRIWGESVSAGADIQKMIAAGLTQQMSATELSKTLKAYVDPAVRKTWDRKKQREIFGPGYQSWNKEIEYNSLRLARTTITHMSTLALKKSCNSNPYIDGLKWHTSSAHGMRMHGRTDICDEYETSNSYGFGDGVFPIDACPFDHPNGLCYQTTFSLKTLDEIGTELKDWVDGKENIIMDNWAKNFPGMYDIVKAKLLPEIVKIIDTRLSSDVKEVTNLDDLSTKYGIDFKAQDDIIKEMNPDIYKSIDESLSKIQTILPDGYDLKSMVKEVNFTNTTSSTKDKIISIDIRNFNKPRFKVTESVTHEFMHALHDELIRTIYALEPSTPKGFTKIQYFLYHLRKDTVNSFDLTMGKKDLLAVADLLSENATKDMFEFFADAMTEAIDSLTPREMALKYYDVLKEKVGLKDLGIELKTIVSEIIKPVETVIKESVVKDVIKKEAKVKIKADSVTKLAKIEEKRVLEVEKKIDKMKEVGPTGKAPDLVSTHGEFMSTGMDNYDFEAKYGLDTEGIYDKYFSKFTDEAARLDAQKAKIESITRARGSRNSLAWADESTGDPIGFATYNGYAYFNNTDEMVSVAHLVSDRATDENAIMMIRELADKAMKEKRGLMFPLGATGDDKYIIDLMDRLGLSKYRITDNAGRESFMIPKKDLKTFVQYGTMDKSELVRKVTGLVKSPIDFVGDKVQSEINRTVKKFDLFGSASVQKDTIKVESKYGPFNPVALDEQKLWWDHSIKFANIGEDELKNWDADEIIKVKATLEDYKLNKFSTATLTSVEDTGYSKLPDTIATFNYKSIFENENVDELLHLISHDGNIEDRIQMLREVAQKAIDFDRPLIINADNEEFADIFKRLDMQRFLTRDKMLDDNVYYLSKSDLGTLVKDGTFNKADIITTIIPPPPIDNSKMGLIQELKIDDLKSNSSVLVSQELRDIIELNKVDYLSDDIGSKIHVIKYKDEYTVISGDEYVALAKLEDIKTIKAQLVDVDEMIASGKMGVLPRESKTLINFPAHQAKFTQDHLRDYGGQDLVDKAIGNITIMAENSETRSRINQDILGLVLKDGKFKGQIETGTGNGTKNATLRKNASTKMFGTIQAQTSKNEYEYYGYLWHSDYISDLKECGAGQYGHAIVQFKGVRNITTFTTTDSLGPGESGRMLPSLLEEPTPAWQTSSAETRDIADLKGNIITPQQVLKDMGGRYIEAQYHGGLTLDDVEEIVIGFSSRGYGVTSVDMKVVQGLRDRGIRVGSVDLSKNPMSNADILWY